MCNRLDTIAPIRILVIDDDDSSLELAKRVAEHMGHTVLTAGDGVQGVALARSEPPDLLLLDLRMPGVTGLQVVREVRADVSLRDLKSRPG